MAEEHSGPRPVARAPWTKIFTAFKVALDIKKLLLAAAGILATAFGWWLLAVVFFTLGGTQAPYAGEYFTNAKTEQEKEEAWKSFKQARDRWNLRYEMAGPAPSGPGDAKLYEAVDIAQTYREYEAIQAHDRFLEIVEVRKSEDGGYVMVIGGTRYALSPAVAKETAGLESLVGRPFTVGGLILGEKPLVQIGGVPVAVAQDKYEALRTYRGEAKSLEELRAVQVKDKQDYRLAALKAYEERLKLGRYKPHGTLRTLPWFEERGPNPYLVVSEAVKPAGPEQTRHLPWASGQFLSWFFSNQLPVLLEPLVKFLAPIGYFFHRDAGGFNRVYLVFVILWTLAVWGFFGGAITRMAAVQVARNEKISMREALRFARERFQSFFAAPVFPLIFVGVLTFFLILFGLFSGLIPILGDVLISGLMWPVVIILGLVMAVVLVGLLGWPLMNATISTEGSDSFDALSRSYSYVYQAPWHYLWYSVVALAYGAVLIFFVVLMGSLMVYLGQWGVNQAPFLASSKEASDRQPHYLFVYAPTSFGWRDLLLHSSPFAETKQSVLPTGYTRRTYEMSRAYMDTMKPWNYIGAFLVAVWLYLVFLLVVGFGYSFFWTAGTIIYLLMRHHVDDTDMDEVHLEEEGLDEPFTKEPPPAAPGATAPGAAKPAAPGNVTMVEAPSLRSAPPTTLAPSVPEPPPTTVVTPARPATPPAPTTPSEASAVENKPPSEGTAPPAP